MMYSGLQSNDFLSRNAWILLIIAAFSMILASAATWSDLDGDDATSFAYHALGRDRGLQEPYKAYHSMMDAVLSVFPSDVNLIRSVGIGLTKVGTIATVILMLVLTFQSLGGLLVSQRLLITAFLLILSPELYYFGLVYSPTMLGFALILSGHLILRRAGNWRSPWFLLSIFIFAFGAAFRWNLIAYGLVVIADILVIKWSRRGDPTLGLGWATVWGIGVLTLTLGLILLNGYSFAEIVSTFRVVEEVTTQQGAVVSGTFQISLETLLALLPLLTPAFVLCCLVGLIYLLRQRDLSLLPIVVGIVVCLPWISSGVPKFLIVMIPGLIFCVAQGLLVLWDLSRKQANRNGLRGAFIAVALAPWFVGISITKEGSQWGPGFQLRDYDSLESGSSFPLHLGAGTAYPTPESVRPLGGHFFVLLGGEWRAFNQGHILENETLVITVVKRSLPLVVLCWSPDYFVNLLIERGYSTKDADNAAWIENNRFVVRVFEKQDAISIMLIYQEIVGELGVEHLPDLLSLKAFSPQVVVYGYSRTMRTLYDLAPDAMEKLGRRSAVLDLSLLALVRIE